MFGQRSGGDAGGEVLALEAAPDRVKALYPEERLLTHANHFESGCMESVGKKKYRPHCTGRRGRGNSFRLIMVRSEQRPFDRRSGITSETRRASANILMNHCPKWSANKQTNASFIIDLENRRLLATRGPPCQSEYGEYAL
jgi:isopenicillin-N N-acyltransferase like protein